jgi:hypothetical protein
MTTATRNALALMVVAIVVGGGRADAYSTPPSWQPMSMPQVTYDPATNKLSVQTKPVVLLGTNTYASGSGGAPGIAVFEPTQVWGLLNGSAFSRKLGWYDPNEMTASAIIPTVQSVYGPGAGVWIESVSASPCLESYLAVGLYGVNDDNSQIVDYENPSGVPYSPIFATAGSSARWQWDGLMDHNVYAVPFACLSSPNQPFSATYRLYIGDGTGNELMVDKDGNPVSSAATTTLWQWQGPVFVFTSQTGASPGVTVESDAYTATGIADPGTSDIAITAGEYAISHDGGASWSTWTATPGVIENVDRVKVRQTTAAGHGVTTTTTLAIPGVPGPGEFRVTTTTVPDPTWPVKIKDGFDQPSLTYAYSIAHDISEPDNAVIMIREGTLAETFVADREITVTLAGGYSADFSSSTGVTVIQGDGNVMTIKLGGLIIDNISIR